jgi:hypothetical protein
MKLLENHLSDLIIKYEKLDKVKVYILEEKTRSRRFKNRDKNVKI